MSDRKFTMVVILLFVRIVVISATITHAFSDLDKRPIPAPHPTPLSKPPYSGYKGVTIGTT
ncbi:MAG: hypothetical protein ABIO36_01590, partial [Pyrinomonadaceae bacterium]